MTESITGISKVGALDRRRSARDRLWRGAVQGGHAEEEERDDTVQISEEARQRASGKVRKTILEHMAEDEGAPQAGR